MQQGPREPLLAQRVLRSGSPAARGDCREKAVDGHQNVHVSDVAAVARALRKEGVRVLVVGASRAPEELLAEADARSDGENDVYSLLTATPCGEARP